MKTWETMRTEMPLPRAAGPLSMAAGLPGRLSVVLMCLAVGLLCLSGAELRAGEKKKQKAPEQFSSLSFVVLREPSGKPVKNASVVLHFLRADGRQDNEGLQLKTDSEGRASIADIPYGKLRLQAVAHGLQTYGEDVEINAAQQEFVIRLNPPADQVSIYK
jgi:5-hydroxyisourate hydrolase-like protein (transthyretin family)